MTTFDTIKNIKDQLYLRFKIHVDQQQPLLLQGEQLQDDDLIKCYDNSKGPLLEINLGIYKYICSYIVQVVNYRQA